MNKSLIKSLFSLILAVALGISPAMSLALVPISAQAAANTLDMWWPTDGAHMQGTQPFKGLVENADVSQYDMYWQVDGGQLNPMPTSNDGYPHKEVIVDLSGWSWHNAGPYAITFVAKDKSGNVIAQKTANVYNDGAALAQTTTVTAQPAPAPTSTATSAPATSPVTTATVASQPAPTVSVSVNPWWPKDGVTVTGTQPFKASIDSLTVDQYSMYWSVDGGSQVPMYTNYTDYPHKETSVNLSGWTWKGSGPYSVTFTAKNLSGNVIAQKTVSIYTGAPAQTTTVTPAPAPTSTTTTAPVTTQPAPSSSNDPIAGLKLYVDPNSNAAQAVKSLAASGDSTDAALVNKIATQPTAIWLGAWSGDVQSAVSGAMKAAQAQGSVPTFVAYNIPQRDCGGYSAGGTTASAYQSWIQGIASGIGSGKAIVIVEPDAIAGITCLSQADQATRYSLISNAVSTLKKNAGTTVYVDAGNSNWVGASDMAGRLKQANIAQADGFSLNVSNFYTTSSSESYGDQLSSLLGGKHYVIDTSRNGNGDNGQWCNPDGRALGQRPSASTGDAAADAFLWIKAPGESDGTCNGGPSAGTWWTQYAIGLASRAAY